MKAVILLFLIYCMCNVHGQSRLTGINTKGPSARISGGTPGSYCEIYYQAAVQVKNEQGNFVPYCGAAVLSIQSVVTTASCLLYLDDEELKPRDVSDVQIVARLLDFDLIEYAQVMDVLNYTLHEEFNVQRGYDNDIAVVRLKEIFWGFEDLRPIPVRTTFTTTLESCVLSGFGSASAEDPPTRKLTRVNVPVIDHAECARIYDQIGLAVTDNMICAGELGKNFCTDDIGGPLVCNGQLAGIASFGASCGDEDVPNVYTEIAKFVPWIKNQTRI